MTGAITSWRWRGLDLQVRLQDCGESKSLLISPPVDVDICGQPASPKNSQRHRLVRAAKLALEFDSMNGELAQEGRSIRIDLKQASQAAAQDPQNVNEALRQRPQISELIYPLFSGLSKSQDLRPFQRHGVDWLLGKTSAILADDMGLGKTAQALIAIGSLVSEASVSGAVVVCPKTLVSNWESECRRWVPELTVMRCIPPSAAKDGVWSALLGRCHVILTTYEQFRVLPRPLTDHGIELLVADEAHRLRRSEAKLVRASRAIEAERFWALTGTPIERNEQDLATLLSLLEPRRFSVGAIGRDSFGLRSLAKPYMLRRLKSDVLNELPDVLDTVESIDLTDSQRTAYERVLTSPLPNETAQALQRFTLLRTICDMDPESHCSAKINRTIEILQTIEGLGEKAVVFSYLLGPLKALAARLSESRDALGTRMLTGEMNLDERAEAVSEFKSDDKIVALLCSSRVGGEGLTLVEANHVIFINEWWNPSANSQARDRVARWGQTRTVQVHRFRCVNTIEETLDLIFATKDEIFARIIQSLSAGRAITGEESSLLLDAIGDAIGLQ